MANLRPVLRLLSRRPTLFSRHTLHGGALAEGVLLIALVAIVAIGVLNATSRQIEIAFCQPRAALSALGNDGVPEIICEVAIGDGGTGGSDPRTIAFSHVEPAAHPGLSNIDGDSLVAFTVRAGQGIRSLTYQLVDNEGRQLDSDTVPNPGSSAVITRHVDIRGAAPGPITLTASAVLADGHTAQARQSAILAVTSDESNLIDHVFSVEPGQVVLGEPQRIAGLSEPRTAVLQTLAGADLVPSRGSLVVNGVVRGPSATVTHNDVIQIRTMAPPILATAHQEILTIGTAQLGRLTVFTRENAKPLGVQHFAPLANLPPARHIHSEILALSDIAPATPVTVSGGDAVLRINGGGWVPSGTMSPGDRVQLRMTSPGSGLASLTATLDIGGTEREWRLTTLDTNARVRAFAIPATTGAIPGSSAISRAIYITGNKAPVTVSVAGSGNPEIRVGIGPWAQSAEVSPGERIQLRAIAPSGTGASRSISVTAGDYVTSWTVSTGR